MINEDLQVSLPFFKDPRAATLSGVVHDSSLKEVWSAFSIFLDKLSVLLLDICKIFDCYGCPVVT